MIRLGGYDPGVLGLVIAEPAAPVPHRALRLTPELRRIGLFAGGAVAGVAVVVVLARRAAG